MADKGIGDFFLSDIDDDLLDDEEMIAAPVVVTQPSAVAPVATQPAVDPAAPPQVSAPVQPVVPAAEPVPAVQPPAPVPPIAAAAPVPAPAQQVAPAPQAVPSAAARPQAEAHQATREERLARALDDLMEGTHEIQAAALVSLDGFTMASALPSGMQEDRVGAMSAAILGLGERAAAELGRGQLSQVFIEGEDGYVLLMAVGTRAVLTVLAARDVKLGLVLFDMRSAAASMAEILG